MKRDIHMNIGSFEDTYQIYSSKFLIHVWCRIPQIDLKMAIIQAHTLKVDPLFFGGRYKF